MDYAGTVRARLGYVTADEVVKYELKVFKRFDADHDGWAELLVHTSDGSSSVFTLYLCSFDESCLC